MLEMLEQHKNNESWEDIQAKFGDYLGIEEPVSRGVLRRAMEDSRFADYLITCRNRPKYLAALLNDPRNQEYEMLEPTIEKSNRQLAIEAAKALLKWGKAGFSQVDRATFERRFGACQACPHLVEPPNKLVYKVKLSPEADLRVCNACGCVAARKARLPTESCPVADPNQPGLNHWGEPLVVQNQNTLKPMEV